MAKFEKIKQVIDSSYHTRVKNLQRKYDPQIINEKIKSRLEDDPSFTLSKTKSTVIRDESPDKYKLKSAHEIIQ